MTEVARTFRDTLRFCGGCLLSFVLWSVWLALGILAAAQLYVLTTNELAIPGVVLRRIESGLEKKGLRVTFERTRFDPTGRVLVEDARVYLPEYAGPVVTIRAAYVRLNPLALALGNIEATEIRVHDVNLFVPAQLSPSGRAEPIVRGVDAVLAPTENEIAIRQVSGRVGPLVVSAHGAVARPGGGGAANADQMLATVRGRFRDFCGEAIEFQRRLAEFDTPMLDLELAPSPTRGAIVTAALLARGLELSDPLQAQAGPFRVTTRFPLLGDAPATSRVEAAVERVGLPNDTELRDVNAVMLGRVRPAQLRVEAVELDVAAAAVRVGAVTAENVTAQIRPQPLPQVEADVVARVLGAPLAVHGRADVKAQTAELALRGAVPSGVLDLISTRVKVDVRKFFDFAAMECERGEATFGPAWKFQRAEAVVALRGINAYSVMMEEGRAELQIDGHQVFAPEAYARIGENFAHGSYTHDFATHDFRFLLRGQLRPLDIGGWFHEWWPHFFTQLEFPQVPPSASVDVRGRWGQGRQTTVFVFADAKAPVIRGEPFERVRTRLFIRPGFYDGLELFAQQPVGSAHGTFTFATNLETGHWRSFDVHATSMLPLSAAIRIGGEPAQHLLAPFQVEGAPLVNASGHFDGPDLPAPQHRTFDLTARTAGRFGFYQFPLSDVGFTLALRDDTLVIDQIDAHFAGGRATGHAKIWGPDDDRRIGFDGALTDASLGLAVAGVQEFSAKRKGQPPPPPDKFVREKTNVRLDIAASAEGRTDSPLSFHGGGSAMLRGAEIGEVPLLGLLSDLLKFTALRFTTAHANFKINGAKLEFSEVALRGANSAIDAHGDYALDRRQLDFKAKIFPFQESGSVIKSVVGAVLTPFSNVFEVKLTGSLENPEWAFVIGPTNLLRSITPDQPDAPASPVASPATKPAATPANPPGSLPAPVIDVPPTK